MYDFLSAGTKNSGRCRAVAVGGASTEVIIIIIIVIIFIIILRLVITSFRPTRSLFCHTLTLSFSCCAILAKRN